MSTLWMLNHMSLKDLTPKFILIVFVMFAVFAGLVALFIMHYNKTHPVNGPSEQFTNNYIANDHIYAGHRREGYNLFDDSLFTNVITYENDEDPYACGGKLGIDKCLESCKGRCIEFGVTGIGHCFPSD